MEQKFLSYEEQKELVKQSLSGNESATIQLIQLGYGLICEIASKHVAPGVEFEDLVEEGILGLLESIPRYRPEKQTKFITYSCFWIKKRILNYETESTHIHLPQKKALVYKKYEFITNFLFQTLGREPTDEEIIEKLNLTSEEIKNIRNTPTAHLSFSPLDEQNSGVSNNDFEDITIAKILIENALTLLTELERYVIVRKFCLDGSFEAPSNSDLAHELSCSKEWVRQIEVKALKKMNSYLK